MQNTEHMIRNFMFHIHREFLGKVIDVCFLLWNGNIKQFTIQYSNHFMVKFNQITTKEQPA